MDPDDPNRADRDAAALSAAAAEALYLISTQLNLLAMTLDELAHAADPQKLQQVADLSASAIDKARSG
ncbi:hypothetical protein V4F39_06110 [Aquincola sp. MAHUQ-54]|uniref:Uncharacterized protein n=1 Tax=Aquincola agrisoli TaxID=3119538 RepID=A0AAW9QFR6_9BURK